MFVSLVFEAPLAKTSPRLQGQETFSSLHYAPLFMNSTFSSVKFYLFSNFISQLRPFFLFLQSFPLRRLQAHCWTSALDDLESTIFGILLGMCVGLTPYPLALNPDAEVYYCWRIEGEVRLKNSRSAFRLQQFLRTRWGKLPLNLCPCRFWWFLIFLFLWVFFFGFLVHGQGWKCWCKRAGDLLLQGHFVKWWCFERGRDQANIFD